MEFMYAGFWRRFLAISIDHLILGILSLPINLIVNPILRSLLRLDFKTSFVILIIPWLVGHILCWLYFAFFESSSKQATPGKMVMKIIVTNLEGNRISFARATARYWSKLVSTIILMVGFIMAAFTSKKQALHDIIAKTLVIRL